MRIVNTDKRCQLIVPTGTLGVRTAMGILRRLGYQALTSSLGPQVTDNGLIKSTLIDVRLGSNNEIEEAVNVLKCHLRAI